MDRRSTTARTAPRPEASPSRPPIEWSEHDLAGTARNAEMWWELLVAGIDPLPPDMDAVRAEIVALASVVASDAPFAERAAAGTELVKALSAAGREVHAAGGGPDRAEGRVAGLFASPGGVPKRRLEHAEVGWRGVVGDRQAARRHHGRVWQALCLWSAEVIAAMAAEGHPIFPGAAGENVTMAGVDWAALRPGTRLRLGEALAEVTVPTTPCATNRAWFLEGNFNRMHHRRHPGQSRQYALVVEPGVVAVGDPVIVEP